MNDMLLNIHISVYSNSDSFGAKKKQILECSGDIK